MMLNEINFEYIEKFPVNLKWGHNNYHQERFFYSDDRYIYKIWHRKYSAHRLEVVAGKYCQYKFKNKNSQIAAIDCDLVNGKTCPAFVDVIFDNQNICRGLYS